MFTMVVLFVVEHVSRSVLRVVRISRTWMGAARAPAQLDKIFNLKNYMYVFKIINILNDRRKHCAYSNFSATVTIKLSGNIS